MGVPINEYRNSKFSCVCSLVRFELLGCWILLTWSTDIASVMLRITYTSVYINIYIYINVYILYITSGCCNPLMNDKPRDLFPAWKHGRGFYGGTHGCFCVCVFRYVIWFQRGYQDIDTATSATTTKLKGISLTNYTQLNISLHGGSNGLRVWDVADYVVPPQVRHYKFIL